METIGEQDRATRAAHRRRGLLGGLVALVLAAYPLAWALSLTHSWYSGCWTTCGGTPDRTVGTFWAIAAAALLATPFVIALTAARVRSWAAWAAAALVVLLTVGAWVAFSLDPANADFFVR